MVTKSGFLVRKREAADDILNEIKEAQKVQVEKEKEYKPFYEIKWKLRDNDETNEREIREIKVNYRKLVDVLKDLGFRRLNIGEKSFIVKIEDNLAEEVTEQKIIDAFEDYLNQWGINLPDGVMKEPLLDKMYKSLGTYFNEKVLHRLRDDHPIEFNNHTREAAFFYYKNGFVKVTANTIKLHPYSELNGRIWKNQILPREYKPVTSDSCKESPFVRFCRNIANTWEKHPKTGEQNPTYDATRFPVLQNIIGYCLHGYFEGKLRAIILTDSRISEEASGRTGKTLICKAMSYMINSEKHAKTYTEINGKDFDTKDRFKYQELALDTRLVHINDASRGFSFEDLFNDITEGIKCQRKNEMPFPVMTKMVISTNRTIRIQGDSAKDRCIEFEMADYYSAEYSPENEFKHWFFRDWDADDWACFDNFMMQCVQSYLRAGKLERPAPINLLERKLREETALEFVNFINDLAPVHKEYYEKQKLLSDFKAQYPDDFPKLTSKMFTRWLRTYCQFHPDFEGYDESRSNSKNYFIFLRKTEEGSGEEVKIKDELPF